MPPRDHHRADHMTGIIGLRACLAMTESVEDEGVGESSALAFASPPPVAPPYSSVCVGPPVGAHHSPSVPVATRTCAEMRRDGALSTCEHDIQPSWDAGHPDQGRSPPLP